MLQGSSFNTIRVMTASYSKDAVLRIFNVIRYYRFWLLRVLKLCGKNMSPEIIIYPHDVFEM